MMFGIFDDKRVLLLEALSQTTTSTTSHRLTTRHVIRCTHCVSFVLSSLSLVVIKLRLMDMFTGQKSKSQAGK